MKLDKKEFVQRLDRTAEKNPLLWLPCVVLLTVILVVSRLGERLRAAVRSKGIALSGGHSEAAIYKPLGLRVLAMTLVVAFSFMLVPEFGEVISIGVFAEESVEGDYSAEGSEESYDNNEDLQVDGEESEDNNEDSQVGGEESQDNNEDSQTDSKESYDNETVPLAGDIIDSGQCGDNVFWELADDGTLTISGSGDMYNYKSEESPFYNNESILNIIIDNAVTSIGDYAFSYCYNLIDITIPDSITYIGSYAFKECRELTNITIPDSVTLICSGAFSYCTRLTSITIPGSIPFIDGYTFEYCLSLTNIKIPNGITAIGYYAFHHCSSLTNITIPDSVVGINWNAFRDCRNLTNITIPRATAIGSNAFFGCENLTIHGYAGSDAETYAKDYHIKFVEILDDDENDDTDDDIFTPKTITSENGLLSYTGFIRNGILLRDYKQYSVEYLSVKLTNSETYTVNDIEWEVDSDIIEIGAKDTYDQFGRCFFTIWEEGSATITAKLPNGEKLDLPILVNGSNFEVGIMSATTKNNYGTSASVEYYNDPTEIRFDLYTSCSMPKIMPDSEGGTQSYGRALELYNNMISKLSVNTIDNIKFTLPDGFSFEDGSKTNEFRLIIPLKINEQIRITAMQKVKMDIYPVMNENIRAKFYNFDVDVIINNDTYSDHGFITVFNADYIPPTIADDDSSFSSDAINEAVKAFESCYNKYLNGKGSTTSTIRRGFSELSKYISEPWFKKIVADTEMFCTLEMMGISSGGDYDLSKIFGYDGLKGSGKLDLGKKTVLKFDNVSLNPKFSKKNKTITAYVEISNTGASIGGASASMCTVNVYIKVGDDGMHCGTAVITYSNLSSLKDELQKIYKDTVHANGGVDDYEYWIKTAISDYLGKKVLDMQGAGDIVSFIDKIYKSVSGLNLNSFTLNSVKSMNELFKDVYGVASGKQKLIAILCPVDVEIYDSENNLVGAIINNTVMVSTDQAVMTVEGDTKHCLLDLSDEYMIYLSGTDNGTMDYIVEEIVNGETIRTVQINDLLLTPDKDYYGNVSDVVFQDAELYALVDDNETIYDVSADSFSFDSTFENVIITVPENVSVYRGNEQIINDEIVKTNDKLTISASVPAGYKLESLKVNGVSISNGGTYTVGSEDITITVEYSKINGDHSHTSASGWSYNEKNHWKVCTDCGEMLDYAAHNQDKVTVTVEPTETKEGSRTYSCTVCGYAVRTETIPATGWDDPTPPGGYGGGSSYVPSSGSTPAPGSVDVKTFNVKMENMITGQSKKVRTVRTGKDYTANVGLENKGYYANIYTLDDEFLTYAYIKNAKAVFILEEIVDFYIVIDAYPHSNDVSAAAGAYGASVPIETAAVPVSDGVTVPAVKLPNIMKFSNKKRRYKILRRRKLDDTVFVY